MSKQHSKRAVPIQTIEDCIFIVRGVKVILDADLAMLYEVPTKQLNQQVKRNRQKFPEDFMFNLTEEELATIIHIKSNNQEMNRSQNVTGSQKHRDPRFSPFAFTEYGALQASNVLNSPKATAMSLYIIRAFVRMREIFVVNQILETRLTEIEKILISHDGELKDLHEKIKRLLASPVTNAIGFQLVGPRPGKIG